MDLKIDDLNVVYIDKGDSKHKNYLEDAKRSNELNAIKENLDNRGVILDSDSAVVREVGINKTNNMRKKVEGIWQVIFPNLENGKRNGSTFYTVGPKGKIVFNVTDENKDTQNISYYEQGKVETMKLEKGEIVESTKSLIPPTTNAITCREVCGVICAGGFGAQIGGCVKECRLAGPGFWWCSSLCTIIVGLGCLIGCDNLCSIFGK